MVVGRSRPAPLMKAEGRSRPLLVIYMESPGDISTSSVQEYGVQFVLRTECEGEKEYSFRGEIRVGSGLNLHRLHSTCVLHIGNPSVAWGKWFFHCNINYICSVSQFCASSVQSLQSTVHLRHYSGFSICSVGFSVIVSIMK